MIRYRLRCDQGHEFEGWYGGSADYDRLRAAGQVSCVHCGSAAVEKMLMTPSVAPSGKTAPPEPAPAADITDPALEKLRREVEAKSDYVGLRFAREARAMHDGDIPERPIHGEARLDEARALLKDGVPVLPLPFVPRRRQN